MADPVAVVEHKGHGHKRRSGTSGKESFRREKRASVKVETMGETCERLIMAQAEVECRRWTNCQLREALAMATADAEGRTCQLASQRQDLCLAQDRLRWHENVRDIASSAAVSGMLNFDRGDSMPSWIILEGRRLAD